MNRTVEQMSRSPFSGDPHHNGGQRHIPILPSSTAATNPVPGDPMEVAQSASMAPPTLSSPEMEHETTNSDGVQGDSIQNTNGTSSNTLSAAAAASAQQPKVVQTAFIHKLYNMLEDRSIQHLISWSNNNESFVMSPSSDFSKVLAQYFKHTNISSFVRQLNMYGFHKVSDVFHTGSPESTLWEFKHGNGNFKRGDLVGLREIKRRASRHALIHRDSFSSPHKPSISQPGTPAEPIADTGEARLANLEHNLYDVHARLMRTEESNNVLSARCMALTENLVKSHQWNHDISSALLAMIADHDTQIYREVSAIQKDVSRQLDMIRSIEEPHESVLPGRQPYFSNMALEPLSPRQAPQDERRASLQAVPSRSNLYRPPVPSHLSLSPRRYENIGAGNPSPHYQRNNLQPPAPPIQHPLSSVSEPLGPNLGRRHTSADIRVPGWPGHGSSPFTSGPSSARWPSSPNRTPNPGDQQVRDVLAQYELGGPRRTFEPRQNTPPLTSDTTPSTLSAESGWSLGVSKFPQRYLDSAPQTRRSSMASNVHSLLNPAETAERDEDDGVGDDRKRKRLQ